MNRKVPVILRRVEKIWVFAILALVLSTGVSQAQAQDVSVECGSNTCFILCRPNVQNTDELTAYITQAHTRLAQADQSLTAEAVITFVAPVAIGFVSQVTQSLPVTGISTRILSEAAGDLTLAFPPTEGEGDSVQIGETAAVVVSMRLTSSVATLNALALDSNVLCVDVGALDIVDQYQNPMIIVTEDLYQAASLFGPAPKIFAPTEPLSHSLSQNSPNPFNLSTKISFALSETAEVRLEVYNMLGQLVKTLFHGRLEAGNHSYEWNSNEAASGMYLYRLTANNFSQTKKMMLLK